MPGRMLLVLLLSAAVNANQKFYMKLFADAGIGINCPSGNKVYIHPINGDLQQCSQQLGSYNETSCPDGTVCERFPILIPGFQDYCCWSDSSITDSESTIIGPTTEVPEELIPFTEVAPMRKLVVTAMPERPEDENEEESSNEEIEYVKPTTRRPRSRKTTTPPTTTEEPPETTKKPTSHRRLPKCRNPDAQPLIDFGNRLRECHYMPCPRGYTCEPNTEIRKLICCGQSAIIVPPVGLPMIPAPKPLIPRPMRPRPFSLNDGDDYYQSGPSNQQGSQRPFEGNGCPQNQNGCPLQKPNSQGQGQGQWNEGCNFGPNNSGCNMENNQNRNKGGGDDCPYSNQGCGSNWNKNNQNNMEADQQPSPRMVRPLPEPTPLTPRGEPQSWGDNYKPISLPSERPNSPQNWENTYQGNNRERNGEQIWGPENWENNNNNYNNNNNDNDDNDNNNRNNYQIRFGPGNEPWDQPQQPRTQNWENEKNSINEMGPGNRYEEPWDQPRQENWEKYSQQGQQNWESTSGKIGVSPRNWENTRGNQGNNGAIQEQWENGPMSQNQWENSIQNSRPRGQTEWENSMNVPSSKQQNWENEGSMNGQWENSNSPMSEPQMRSFQWNKIGMGSSKGKPISQTCAAGSEFVLQGSAPKCVPPGSDSCPLSHPRCIPSASLGHNVCCF